MRRAAALQLIRVVRRRNARIVPLPFHYSRPMRSQRPHRVTTAMLLVLGLNTSCRRAMPEQYDLVVAGGRVMDPESGLDAVRDLGIRGSSIAAISDAPLTGKDTLDARGLVVAPGFVDLHQHSFDAISLTLKAADGVTSAFEMEGGVPDVTSWYADLEGRSPINFGATAGHGFHRAAAPDKPLDDSAVTRLTGALRRELGAGALGIGMILEETPGATPWEVLQVFRTAAEFTGARVHVHVRGTEPRQYWSETEEVLAAALVSGAPLQIVHVNSSYGEDAGKLLALVRASRARGLDVTVEAYPYTASMTNIESPAFDDWPSWSPSKFSRFEWPASGERLTRESFARHRREKGLVFSYDNDEATVRSILSDSLVMVASDGLADASGAHPRGAGTFARVVGRYVREDSLLTLMGAIRKATLLPVQALEGRAPAMRRKGRIQPSMDADLVVFDPATLADRATYREPRLPSAGIRHVVVNGTPVIRSGQTVADARPGAAIRALRPQ